MRRTNAYNGFPLASVSTKPNVLSLALSSERCIVVCPSSRMPYIRKPLAIPGSMVMISSSNNWLPLDTFEDVDVDLGACDGVDAGRCHSLEGYEEDLLEELGVLHPEMATMAETVKKR